MNRNISSSFLFVLLSLFFFSGCSADDDAGDAGFVSDTPLVVSSYTVSDALATRAPSLSSFSAGLFFSDSDTNNSYGTDYANAKYTTAANNSLTPDGGSTLYWQSRNNVTVTSYAPYNEDWSSLSGDYAFSVSADQSVANNYTASDLLRARSSGISFGNTISLEYKHLLSRLQITLSPDGTSITSDNWAAISDPSSDLSVKVVGTLLDGTVNLSEGTVSATAGSGGTITAYVNSDGTNTGYEAIIFPQTVSDGNGLVEISFTYNSKPYTFLYRVGSSDQMFESGKSYTYALTVSRSGVSLGSVSIGEWGGSSDAATTGNSDALYQVGDYYPHPNNSNTAIGVVFWLDPAAEGYDSVNKRGWHGKIVSLDEGTGLNWDQNDAGNDAGGYYDTGATSTSDGLANMVTIQKYISDRSKSWSNFPAFKWVHGKNDTDTDYTTVSTGVWYLPSIGELGYSNSSSLYEVFNDYGKDAFNGKLTDAGGTALSNTWYWSSTEGDDDTAWVVNFGGGGTLDVDKYSNPRVRAVSAF